MSHENQPKYVGKYIYIGLWIIWIIHNFGYPAIPSNSHLAGTSSVEPRNPREHMAQARARLAACGAGDWAEALLVLEVVRGSVGLGSTESYSCKGRLSHVYTENS